MTAQSAEEPGRSAAATPGAMLAPARLQSTVAPLASMASARTLLVVVLPLVPHTTMAPRRSLCESSAMRCGSTASATLPGSCEAERCSTFLSPHVVRRPIPWAMDPLSPMGYSASPSVASSSEEWPRFMRSYSSGVSTSSMRRLTPPTSRPVMPTTCLTTTFLTSSNTCGA